MIAVRRHLAMVTGTAAVLGLAVAVPASGQPAPQAVTIEFRAFTPDQLDVLPGETVKWSNVSLQNHTVTADDGSFDSGTIGGGSSFSLTFSSPGAYMYHCTIHPDMMGEVDVRRVILDPLPSRPVQRGQAVTLTGRSADGASAVEIQQATTTGYRVLASTTPGPDGRWSATISAPSTSSLRAASGSDVSEARRLLVIDRNLHVRLAGHTVLVTVAPPAPGATVVLERYLRERFGWWPVARRRLGHGSRASFRITGRAPARVELVDSDGWTPLVISAGLRVSR
jgi:plastocyanin